MTILYFFSVFFFCFLKSIPAAGPVNTSKLGKERAIALIETIEDLLKKAKNDFPSCKEDVNTNDGSECVGQKSLAHIAVSRNLLSDVKKNFPTCSNPIEKDEKDKEDEKIVQVEKFSNCSEIFASGRSESGVYTIWVGEPGKPLQVYCDMETDEGGWTVIQRRGKFPVQLDFNKVWKRYVEGFGNVTEEFWLGLENMRILCLLGCEIRFDLEDENAYKGFALYQNFKLSSDNYRLSINGYYGNVGDGMQHHNNRDFSTRDKGDTRNIKRFGGGWWMGSGGYYCNLNGNFQPNSYNQLTVGWYTWRKMANLASVEMKVRPN